MSIRIITEPTVRLIGRQVIDDAALTAFLKDEDAVGWETDTLVSAEKLIEVAGRMCYSSYAKPRPGGNLAYLTHIKEVGHGSVLEAAVFSLIITGVSRSLTHELVRHRVGISPSMRSQRYCDEKDAAFVVPPEYRHEVDAALSYIRVVVGRPDATALDVSMDMRNRRPMDRATEAGMVWLEMMETSRRAYEFLSGYGMRKHAAIEDKTARRKMAREAARSVLPNATATEIFLTGNARALRHFLELRGSAGADAEMQRLSIVLLATLQAEAANLFGDYRVVDGCVTTPYPKV